MSNRISVVIDVVADKATRGFKTFSDAVGSAETRMGKFKAGAGVALDQVKANAGELAMAGGAALVAFGAKAVSEFNDLAISAGKLSDALGMPVEDASRLIEVAGDVGIEVADLESTIGRMNRVASSTPGAFDEIGAAIARNADGTVNVNETFLNTVDALNRIPDATKRAEAAQAIFGRSWMNIAELVGQGSDEIKTSLAEVSDQKIIDEDEVRKARDYRAAMDNLKDAIEDVTLELGERLTPIVQQAVDTIMLLSEGAQEADEKTGGWLSTANRWAGEGVKWATGIKNIENLVNEYSGSAEEAAEETEQLADKTADLERNAYGAANKVREVEVSLWDFAKAAAESAGKITGIESAWARLTSALSNRRSLLDIADGFDSIEAAALEAYAAAQEGSIDAEGKARDYERALIDQKQRVIEYAKEVLGLPPEQITDVLALIDQGKVAEAEAALAHLERDRTVRLNVQAAITAGAQQVLNALGRWGGTNFTVRNHSNAQIAGAEGGIVNRPTMALIGEAGPEAVIPLHRSPGNGPLPANLGGGGGYVFAPNITVNAGIGTNGAQVGRQIVDALNEHYRNGGRPPNK